jgi:hypothetical protein
VSSDLERLPARVPAAAPGAGPAVLAAELLGRVRAELPVVGELGERDQVLVAAWLTGLRSARTRRAYAGDVAAWLGWLAGRDTGVLAAGRVHVDLWAATQLDDGAAASSVSPRPDRRGRAAAEEVGSPGTGWGHFCEFRDVTYVPARCRARGQGSRQSKDYGSS